MKRILITLAFLIGCSGLIFAQDIKEYNAVVNSVYDGDTITAVFSLGFGITIEEKCRLIGIDTSEIRTKDPIEKQKGLATRDFVRERILGKEVVIKTSGKGKFGRILSEILYINEEGEEVNLNHELIEEGLALPYWGGKRD